MGLCGSSHIPPHRSHSASNDQLQAILSELQSQGMHLEALARLSDSKKKKPRGADSHYVNHEEFFQINIQPPSHERSNSSYVRPHSDNAGVSTDFQALISQNELLQRRLQGFEEWKKKAVLRSLFKLYSSFWFVRVHHCFQMWKYPEVSALYSDIDVSSIDQESISIAREHFESDNQRLLRENPLLKYSNPSLVEKPISRTNLFKLFDDLLDKKQEADSIDLDQYRTPRPIPEFTMEFLNRVYGLKKLASSMLSSVLAALKELYEEGHAYGTFLCRLLQLYHPEPITTTLAVYLLTARLEFNKVANKYRESDLAFRSPSREKGKRMAFLVDVLNLFTAFFETDKVSRVLAFKLVKPETMSAEEFALFWIGYKMVKTAQTSESLFVSIDQAELGFVSEEELVGGLKRYLELPKDDAEYMVKLFPFTQGRLYKDQFTGRLSRNAFYETCKNSSCAITITEFFNALIEAYNTMLIKDAAYIRSWFCSFTSKVDCLSQFTALIQSLDVGVSMDLVELMFQETGQEIDCDDFTEIVMKYQIGGFGARDFRRENVLCKKRRMSEVTEIEGPGSPLTPHPLLCPSTPSSYLQRSGSGIPRPRSVCIPQKL